jgi:hypothetical protein
MQGDNNALLFVLHVLYDSIVSEHLRHRKVASAIFMGAMLVHPEEMVLEKVLLDKCFDFPSIMGKNVLQKCLPPKSRLLYNSHRRFSF